MISNRDLYGDNPPATYDESLFFSECPELEVGQEFIVEENKFPSGFCPWAFADIHRDITHLQFRGEYPWVKDKGVIIACCTDGNKPTIFKLERIED